MEKLLVLIAVFALPCISARGEEEWKPAIPIRMGKIRGNIEKQFVERLENGFKVRSEKVCSYEATISVYDVRGRKDYYQVKPTVTCDSTVNGHPVQVVMSGYISLSERKVVDETVPVKSAGVHLYVRPGATPPRSLPADLVGSVSTRDLAAKSFILDIYSVPRLSSPGLRDGETFSSTVELIDDAQ